MIVGICDDESRIRDILENKVRRLMPQARIVKFSSCEGISVHNIFCIKMACSRKRVTAYDAD